MEIIIDPHVEKIEKMQNQLEALVNHKDLQKVILPY